MKIEIIIFNILVLILLIYLIYLYIYINYRYEGFADANNYTKDTDLGTSSAIAVSIKSQDDVVNSTIDQDFLRINDVFSKADYDSIDKNKFDGNSSEFAYPSQIIPQIKKNFEKFKLLFPNNTSLQGLKFPDGYYWIKFKNESRKLIYCIMNEAYFGGGWMLAMRGVKNSTTFKYDSSYWTSTETLNDTESNIKNTLVDVLKIGTGDMDIDIMRKNDDLKSISSIGNLIFKTDLNQNTFDIKTDAFNFHDSREWMAIFYHKTGEMITRGGDIILASEGGKTEGTNPQPISSKNKNTRGWIWREVARTTKANGDPEPMRELFYNRRVSTTGDNSGFDATNNYWDFLSKYGITNARGLNKWRKQNTDTGITLWSAQEGFNFYGVNWQYPLSGRMWGVGREFKVRWGFIWNNEVDINNQTSDAACGIGMADHSCRDEWRWNGTQTKGCNESIAFEIYVR